VNGGDLTPSRNHTRSLSSIAFAAPFYVRRDISARGPDRPIVVDEPVRELAATLRFDRYAGRRHHVSRPLLRTRADDGTWNTRSPTPIRSPDAPNALTTPRATAHGGTTEKQKPTTIGTTDSTRNGVTPTRTCRFRDNSPS